MILTKFYAIGCFINLIYIHLKAQHIVQKTISVHFKFTIIVFSRHLNEIDVVRYSVQSSLSTICKKPIQINSND